MNYIKRTLLSMILAFSMMINGVFANPMQDALDSVRELFTSHAVISGIAIFMIFWGLYALFFYLTRFFVKGDGHHRLRVVFGAVLSFFVGSFFILSLEDAGERLGYVVGAWLFLILLIAIFFVGVVTLYKKFLGENKNEGSNSTKRIVLLVLSLLVFLFIYSLVFAKVSHIVLTDGQGTLNLFSQGTIDENTSIEAMLNEVYNEAESQGGISGGIIGVMALLLSSLFEFIFTVALIALFIIGLVKISTLGSSGNDSHEDSEFKNEINEIRDLIKKMNTSLKDASTHFNNKTKLLNRLVPNPNSNKQKNNDDESEETNTNSSGIPNQIIGLRNKGNKDNTNGSWIPNQITGLRNKGNK